MTPYDNVGRIHKQAFLVSNVVLFVVCLIATTARFYVRIRVQQQLSVDDGILLLGVLCLISAMALLFTIIDKLYVIGAIENGVPVDQLPSNFIEQAYDGQKFLDGAMILCWCSIVSVKYSYLFLFKRLIDRVQPMVIFWWFAAVFNGLLSAYGVSMYILTCPTFYNLNVFNCAFGSGLKRSLAYGISQAVLDITGDLLILFIPCYLIWKIRIRWSQKVALSCCLCLTILTIICSITRIAGCRTKVSTDAVPSTDSVWEVYWLFIAANITIAMTAATAFRVFFVKIGTEKVQGSSGSFTTWFFKFRQLLRSTFTSRSRRSKTSADGSQDDKPLSDNVHLSLQIPRGTITGVRTIIKGQGKTTGRPSQVMHSMLEDENEDSWPLSGHSMSVGVIGVQQDITLRYEDAC